MRYSKVFALLFLELVVLACLIFSTEDGFSQDVSVGKFSRASIDFDISSVDDAETVFVIRQIAQSLVEYDESGQIIPSLAKSWTVSQDMRAYTFNLRKSAKFSDGTPLTVSDAKYSLDVIMKASANPISQCIKKIDEIEALSEYQLKVTLHKPWPDFLHCLASGLVPIFSEKMHRYYKMFLSSGSYAIAKENGNFYFVRNIFYSGFYTPKHARFRILLDSDELSPDVLLNSFHMANETEYQKIEVDSFSVSYIMLNPRSQIWQSKENRMAMMKALFAVRDILITRGRVQAMDIYPKGMIGFDIEHRAFKRLKNYSDESEKKYFEKEIVFGSPKELPMFSEIAKELKVRFGISATNKVANDVRHAIPSMARDKDVDIFAFGWNSIFSHPDACLRPFFELGAAESIPKFQSIMQEVEQQSDRLSQFFLYQKAASYLIENAFVMPLGQRQVAMMMKKNINSKSYRYRYTVQLSEISIGI